MEVITYRYTPFVMGGTVHQYVKCELPVDGPHDLGKGYKGYIIKAPDGRTAITEEITGATAGPDLETVRQDVASATQEDIEKYMAILVKKISAAKTVTPEEFYKLLPKQKDETVDHDPGDDPDQHPGSENPQ